ncbi:competence type IV pilus ATPase ComGA [Alkalihalobacillus deserti]|uniref:competence type IV pilus ATPase ComGA n=1 Tax=Alkalihalobacillus deserti TaxID=2879466 RepID=UPI001D149456|nr:competence type IV pilus ATPase ComGA [Alkalihalobacillus deserti]
MYDIELYSQQLINEAVQMKATDLHFIPDDSQWLLTYRVSGQMEPWKKLNPRLAERLISHFKYRSGMDIGERRKPQSSSMMHVKQDATFALRLSTLPTKSNESLAIRILPYFSSQTLSSLSILHSNAKILQDVTSMTQGLCLISGPTGSGKTTTLYTIIEQIVRQGGKTIITIEDPVERIIPYVVQVEVNVKTGLTFNSLLSACLRHDPDVILIGEIRDEVSAALAIRASLTGHVVLATVHAQDCYTALLRMIDLGVSRFDLMQCCKLILSQRIVNTKCPLCQGSCHLICRRSRQMSRAAIFEILKGEQLKNCISSQTNITKGFLYEINKAWALGYIEEEEWKRVAYEVF